jgi:hypothetical protein
MKTTLILALVGLGCVAAMCPNQCSGHGSCGANDACTCYGNWIDADCSQRRCAYSSAWVDAPSATDTAHWYAECSNKGICDRKTGQCKCFDGYEGKACKRSTCPNDCSGHGTCEYIQELSSAAYTLWDQNKVQGCKCDRGYEGPDCSSRQCPKGDDPMTVGQTDEVQTITFTDADTTAFANSATFTFTDLYGGTWTTRPFTPVKWDNGSEQTTPTANLKAALEGLPNHVIESVTVTAATASNGVAYAVTFDSPHNSGNQNALTCNVGGCNAAGCQPLYTALTGGGAVACAVTSADGTKESSPCSNRGSCDGSTGICACVEGYTDENCGEQTVLL